MHYVYILKDLNCKIYVGSTNNIRRRLREHNRGSTYTTRRMKEPEIIYFEAYQNRECAVEREKKLKSYGSAYHGLLARLKLKKLAR